MTDSDKKYAPSENFKLEEIDGEMLLYHVSTTRTLHLNSSAAVIWQLCDGERTVGEIVELLKENFPDAGEGLAQDVEDAITELADSGVLTSA